MALDAGAVIGGYRIQQELGAGGMGTVYLAADPVLPRLVALKVLSAELSRDEQFRHRFTREADLAATLDHPNIVAVYSRGASDGQLWIAMQYVAGSDAQKELEEGRMTAGRAVHIVGEVAKALDYAHGRHLVHRDVKPANFLLSADGQRVFLADFGIARALDEAVGLTQTGAVMTTVAYAAPEALAGDPVDGRADVYALGCSLYRLLTGRMPFGGAMSAVIAAHLYAPPPRPSEQLVGLPPAMDAVIARAMAKNPAERYGTAQELARAAAAALDMGPTAPVVVPPPRAGEWTPLSGRSPDAAVTYPSGHFSGPRGPAVPPPAPPGQWTAGALAGGAGPGSGSVYGGTVGGGGRRRRWWIAAVLAVVVAVAATLVWWPQSSAPGYTPQTLVHAHGTTRLDQRPHAVAALGPGDGEAVLSLGVQPVVMVAAGGVLPSWDKQLVTDGFPVLPSLDMTAVAAAKPDVIIATGDLDDASYGKLTAIAPTVGRPTGTDWTWQNQLGWVGRILGRSDKAKQLLDSAAAAQADLRSAHPAFDGKTIEVLTVSDAGVAAELADSPAAAYLQGLGFRYTDTWQRSSTDNGQTRPIPDVAQVNSAAPNARVVLRTDKAAGQGSYNGLPQPFVDYRGATIIVDDPNTIAALTSGGYAATEFLNSGLVDALGRQIH
ncbi:serine/threonine-protein kinase [Mycobacterium sp. BK086]|uniref:serine/threonine-protein kinase n=1 Tax=Mycobacterium sp. BK086 TaxID=2512165 RepID=UPI00105BEBC4|nr:serine/threonine-protein kinase [Mycobacterium sp. BK086]TDO06453.1 serine/threonine-protein kinase [Mycobacterium sp. BK086]